MKKAIFIVGPTAVGKTDLAFEVSRTFPSVLISADSVQVFRGADIISGKDKKFPTELLDVIKPTQSFSVRDFVERVRPHVEKASREHKIPIIVGGTGFYVDAIFGKIDTIAIPPNKDLRLNLEKLTIKALQEKLRKVNLARFKKMNNSDVNNPRRLIRAIEVGSRISRVKSVFLEKDVLIIGLKTSMDNLKVRIEKRVKKRIKMGALSEAQKLFENYDTLSSQLKSANGYRELFDFLLGNVTLEKAIEKWANADYLHAKNQMTWFKKNKKILWFDIDSPNFQKEAVNIIKRDLGL